MKPSEELSALVETIKYNCDVADADGSAIFSICGMALRLRDLNKWEMGLPPWKENDSNPFDTQTINRILAPSGLFYGAGYAHSLKPTFFLARIRDAYTQDRIPVKILGEELVRGGEDSAPP